MDQQSAINIAKKYKEAVVNAIGPAKVYLFSDHTARVAPVRTAIST